MLDEARRSTLVWALALAALTLAVEASDAHAHGRPPFVGAVRFHPTDPDLVVARGTWGFALSEDGGATWRWICAAVAGVDPTREDPPFAVMPDGRLLVGSFDGLVRSTPDRCQLDHPDEDLRGVFVIDVLRDPVTPTTAWAILTDGGGPDSLWRSTDGGGDFERVGDPIDDILLERVLVAPSSADRVYLSGAIPISTTGGTRQAFVLRSDDAGATFTRTEIALEDGERNVHVLAVDPTDPDRLLARVLRRVTDERPERLILSEDGAASFSAVASLRDISDADFSADGATAYATSRGDDGLHRSDDGGRTFAAVTGGSLLCTETRAGELWVCADERRVGWSLARSDDRGDTLPPTLTFPQVRTLVDCPPCSEVGYVCPEWFPDLATDLMLDASVGVDGGMTGAARDAQPPEECDASRPMPDAGPPDAGMDAGSAPMDGGPIPPGGEGCGCRAAGGRPAGAPAAALGLLLLVRRRNRRG